MAGWKWFTACLRCISNLSFFYSNRWERASFLSVPIGRTRSERWGFYLIQIPLSMCLHRRDRSPSTGRKKILLSQRGKLSPNPLTLYENMHPFLWILVTNVIIIMYILYYSYWYNAGYTTFDVCMSSTLPTAFLQLDWGCMKRKSVIIASQLTQPASVSTGTLTKRSTFWSGRWPFFLAKLNEFGEWLMGAVYSNFRYNAECAC